jgi:2-hydroxy-3-keto-5-methylthiopentenyl-1-phosphate phosphatase
MASKELVFVLDFDGTITTRDVGNEICDILDSAKYKKLQAQYRAKEITLRQYQKLMWEGLKTSRDNFIKLATGFSQLRPGVREFFDFCSEKSIDVFIASCGIREYIEPVLEKELGSDTRKCLKEVSCHNAEFQDNTLSKLLFRDSEALSGAWPFDKGRWCRELKVRYPDNTVFIGVGNGTSDLNFVGAVDHLMATDAFARYCESNKIPFTEFHDFFAVQERAKTLL